MPAQLSPRGLRVRYSVAMRAPSTIAATGAFCAGLAVVLGAFGAHGLRDVLTPYAADIYQKAVFYQMVHALGLLAVAVLARVELVSAVVAGRVGACFLGGIFLFSGSLYALALSGQRALGAVTPFGGVLFILGWGLLSWKLVTR